MLQSPLQISYRNMEPSAAVEARIRKKVESLQKFYNRLVGCHVMVEAPHRHHHQGKIYHVRIEATLPGAELVVNRDPAEDHSHEDVFVAIRDAFRALKRQMQDYARSHFDPRQKSHLQAHVSPQSARVAKLFPLQNYGFLETPDGREVFFHRHSVLNDAFERLDIGTEVYFHEEAGEKGPQATTVCLP